MPIPTSRLMTAVILPLLLLAPLAMAPASAEAQSPRDVPDLGDRDHYLAHTDALAAHAEAGYAWALEVIRGLSDEEMHAPVTLFGRVRMPGWRALEAAREHAVWTLGQTIPYLRLNGVQPPSYPLFHATEMASGS
jgi:hypothetical protein